MKNVIEFQEFLQALQDEKMEFPNLQYTGNYNDDSGFEFAGEINKKSNELPLEAYIGLLIDLKVKQPKKANIPIPSKALVHSSFKCTFTPTIFCSDPIYDTLEVDPNEWKYLPRRYQETSQNIQQLDDYLESNYSDIGFRSSRDTLAGINSRLSLAGINLTWSELYSNLVTEGRLKWADILGEKFPYVLTNFSVIGNAGTSIGGLYFVASEIAREPWQEQAVAYHEKFCASEGHDFAIEKERELILHLGKEEEHNHWREKINWLFEGVKK